MILTAEKGMIGNKFFNKTFYTLLCRWTIIESLKQHYFIYKSIHNITFSYYMKLFISCKRSIEITKIAKRQGSRITFLIIFFLSERQLISLLLCRSIHNITLFILIIIHHENNYKKFIRNFICCKKGIRLNWNCNWNWHKYIIL